MKTIDKATLLTKTKRRYKVIKFQGDVFTFQNMSELEKSDYEVKIQTSKDFGFEKAKRLLICRTLVDENNLRVFADSDITLLEPLDGRITSVLYATASDHCGYDSSEVEDIIKNSETAAG